ncbi:kin of IRRE-like protein 2 isoform X2 [Procambarus clarkii]|uniref:kin of IRRE-like protein 2 isoform X2 n=1 Tax=Procambarus clarkii TaxID=6728 RepID=UPI0037428980
MRRRPVRCERGVHLCLPGVSAPPIMIFHRPLILVTFLLVAMATVRSQEDEVWSVTGVAGRSSDLPCYLNPRTPGDRPKLILWYKRGGRTPVFSYDGRAPQLQSNFQQAGEALTVSRDAATLTIRSVGVEAAGLYECRVDFFKSPTHTSLVNLTIIEPPHSLEVMDSQTGRAKDGVIGPYYEGQKIIVTCLSRKGTPLPNVTWWQGEQLVDGVWEVTGPSAVQNSLVVERLTREWHNATLTCRASNTHLADPVSVHVVVKMFLLPTSVVIANPGATREGEQLVLLCASKGSRPPAALSWTLNGLAVPAFKESPEFSTGLTAATTSTLVINATREHNGAKVVCRAQNPTRPKSPLSNSTTLNVHYPPTVKATLGRTLNISLLKEGDDVYFDCIVSANPQRSSITWYHEGTAQVQNVTQGVILAGDSLVLQKVGRRQAGQYTCSATNTITTATSDPVTLRIKYTPECLTSHTTYFIYDKPINITCTVSSYPAVNTIQWQWNNSHEVIVTQPEGESQDRASSQLTVQPVVSPEDRALSCWAVNEMGKQAQPCSFSVKVAKMPLPLSSCRLANITDSSLSLSCQRPDVAAAGTTLYRAEVYFENRTLFANVTSHRPNFNVSRLDAETSYQIKVYVTHGPVTSQPVVVSAYTSRTSRTATGNPNSKDSGSSVGGAVGGLVVTVVVLVGVVVGRNYCRRRRGRPKQDPRPPSDDSNPDVVPNIEETYDLLSSAESKADATMYEVLEGSLGEDIPMESLGQHSESYQPLVLQHNSPKEMDDYPGVRTDLYCPVDQLMQAEESVV